MIKLFGIGTKMQSKVFVLVKIKGFVPSDKMQNVTVHILHLRTIDEYANRS